MQWDFHMVQMHILPLSNLGSAWNFEGFSPKGQSHGHGGSTGDAFFFFKPLCKSKYSDYQDVGCVQNIVKNGG